MTTPFGPAPAGAPPLGQGFRGGAAALGSLGPAPGASPSPIGTAPPSSPLRQKPPSGKALTYGRALQLLESVRRGTMEPVDAATELDKILSPQQRHDLTKAVLRRSATQGQNATPELQALKFSPLGIQPGSQASFTQRPAGIGTNLVRQAGQTVVGIVPGIGLAAKAGVQDVGAIAQGKAPTHVYKQVLKPIGEQYAYQYGPLAHGNISEFGRRLQEQPLGPVLDLLGLASAGIGVAGRASSASRAIALAKEATAVSRTGQGAAEVGGRLRIFRDKGGLYTVRQQGRIIAANLPDEKTAVAHAQSLMTEGIMPGSGSLLSRGVGKVAGPVAQAGYRGFTQQGSMGGLIDAYNRHRGQTHDLELEKIGNEIQGVLDSPNLKMKRSSFKEVMQQVKADWGATRQFGKDKAQALATSDVGFMSSKRIAELGPEGEQTLRLSPGAIPRGMASASTALREAMDFVRIAAIYLRPAYLPNNWAGNLFMNMAHQGVLAPINLAKSLVMDDQLGRRYTAAIDNSLGQHAALAGMGGAHRGYIAGAAHPLVQAMGAVADQPFRRAAWLHEARRSGYATLGDVKKLMDKVDAGDQTALRQVSDIARRAQEEIVKFGSMNEVERSLIRNVVFVYSWMKGAGRYTGRFPLQHPIQAGVMTHLGSMGAQYLQEQLGGVPSFLLGAVPIGRDKNGNPILINPFALNPLGSGMQAAQALAGAAKVVLHPSEFNKYAQTDLVNLTHPLIQNYLQAREGGPPVLTQSERSIAPLMLYKGLKHPGSGSVYPGTRTEAVGHYLLGSIYPRKANQAAITRSLEREQKNNPIALIPTQADEYYKKTGQPIPAEFISAYRKDLQTLADMKDFQHKYANDHGSQGFRNMPAANRAEAAVQFLVSIGHMSQQDAAQYQQTLSQVTDETTMSQIANELWSSVGAGQVKRAWQDMMRSVSGSTLQRKRP